MYISSGIIIWAVIFGIYFINKSYRSSLLASCMRNLSSELESLEYSLARQTDRQIELRSAFDFTIPQYKEYMFARYSNAGKYGDGRGDQYLYRISKVRNKNGFCAITLFDFVSNYINNHTRELSTYVDGTYYKTELCKQLDVLYLCSAKECLRIKNIQKFTSIYIDNIERYVSRDTISFI